LTLERYCPDPPPPGANGGLTSWREERYSPNYSPFRMVVGKILSSNN